MAQAARLLLDVLSLLFEKIRNMTFQLALLPDRHVLIMTDFECHRSPKTGTNSNTPRITHCLRLFVNTIQLYCTARFDIGAQCFSSHSDLNDCLLPSSEGPRFSLMFCRECHLCP